MLATPNDKSSLQKTHWQSSTSRKVWWLDNGWSQSPPWGGWITEQSPIRCRGTRLGNTVDFIILMWKQKLLRKRKRVLQKFSEPTRKPKRKTSQEETQKSQMKFLEPTRKPKVVYTDNSLQFCKSCEDLLWNHRTTTTHRLETNGYCGKSGTQNRRRDVCCIIAIRLGMKNGGFYGVLSVTCSRPLGRWGRRFTKDDSEKPFNGPIIPFGAMVECHPTSPKDQARIHQFGKKVSPGIFPGYELIAVWHL